MSRIIRAVLAVVVLAVVVVGVLYWRGMIFRPAPKTASTTAGAPKAKATGTPAPLPSDAPKTLAAADNDPAVIDPFAKRLMTVNTMAHKMLVTNAEYHDSDDGTRYFVAVVTSCKDLNALWPIDKGVLAEKVEGPLRLKSDFATFSFVEYFQQGQWGVQSCEGVT